VLFGMSLVGLSISASASPLFRGVFLQPMVNACLYAFRRLPYGWISRGRCASWLWYLSVLALYCLPPLSHCWNYSTKRIAGVSAFVRESLGVLFSLANLSSDHWNPNTCHLPQDFLLLAYGRVVEYYSRRLLAAHP
jgi:hypothetical protein